MSNPLTRAPSALPPKVYAVIQARLAQLSLQARAVAELAAVIGRAFTVELLAQASRCDEETVAPGVDELWQRRIVREQGVARYDFGHDRIRDVAYAEISPARRRVLHRHVAQALEKQYASDLADVYAPLAVHYHAAGRTDRAIPYLMQAIQIAVDLSALQNALGLVSYGLRIMQSLPETEANIRQAIELYLWQGFLLQACKSWTDPHVQDAFAHVRRLSAQVNDRQSLFLGQTKLRLYYSLRAEWSQAKEIAEQNIALAEQIENPRLLVDAYHALGRVHLYQGNLPEARRRFEVAQVAAEDIEPQDQVKSEGHSTGHNLMNFAHCLALLGYPELARRRMDESLAIARERQDQFALATTMQFDAILSHMLRDVATFERAADGMGRLAQQYEFPFYIEMSDVFDGYAMVRRGQHRQGIEKLQRGIQNYERQEFGMFHVHRMGMLVEAHLIAGAYAQGHEVCENALAYADRTGDQFWVPELHRLKGDLILGQTDAEQEAEESYHQAILLARQQSSKLLELRSSVSLARLWQGQCKGTEAHQILSEVYGWFTEGFDTADLGEAKALLAE